MTMGSPRARLCVLEKSPEGFGFHVDVDEAREAHVVWHVERGSPAHSGGLRAGDAILAVDGRDARTLSHAKVVDAIQESGWRMKLLVCEFQTESTLNLAGLGLSGDVLELALSLESDPLQTKRRLSMDLIASPLCSHSPHFNQGLEPETLLGRRRCSLDVLTSPLATNNPMAMPAARRFSQERGLIHSVPPLLSLMLPMAPLKESKSSCALGEEGASQGHDGRDASLHRPGEGRVGRMKKSSSVGSCLQLLSHQHCGGRKGLCQNEETSIAESGGSEQMLPVPKDASAKADTSASKRPGVARSGTNGAPDWEQHTEDEAPSSSSLASSQSCENGVTKSNSIISGGVSGGSVGGGGGSVGGGGGSSGGGSVGSGGGSGGSVGGGGGSVGGGGGSGGSIGGGGGGGGSIGSGGGSGGSVGGGGGSGGGSGGSIGGGGGSIGSGGGGSGSSVGSGGDSGGIIGSGGGSGGSGGGGSGGSVGSGGGSGGSVGGGSGGSIGSGGGSGSSDGSGSSGGSGGSGRSGGSGGSEGDAPPCDVGAGRKSEGSVDQQPTPRPIGDLRAAMKADRRASGERETPPAGGVSQTTNREPKEKSGSKQPTLCSTLCSFC